MRPSPGKRAMLWIEFLLKSLNRVSISLIGISFSNYLLVLL